MTQATLYPRTAFPRSVFAGTLAGRGAVSNERGFERREFGAGCATFGFCRSCWYVRITNRLAELTFGEVISLSIDPVIKVISLRQTRL